jgi:hypothetical protein
MQLSAAVLARWRASPGHLFLEGLRRRKFSRCGGKCCTRRCAAQIPVRRTKFEPVPSCVYRKGTSAARQSKMNYAFHPCPKGRYAYQHSPVCPVSDTRAAIFGLGPLPLPSGPSSNYLHPARGPARNFMPREQRYARSSSTPRQIPQKKARRHPLGHPEAAQHPRQMLRRLW